MPSDKQLLANRQNSLSSTGPTTKEGKIKTSKNSTTHGLFSRKLNVPTEEAEEFNDFSSSIRTEYQPQNEIEKLLVDRLIVTSWRLRKILGMEADLLSCEDCYLPKTEGRKFQNEKSGFELLVRYETMLERQLYYCLAQLDIRRRSSS